MATARPDPESHEITVRGLRLHYWNWASTAAPPRTRLLLLHATGFHARVWDQVVRRLPPTWNCIALDQRGHGRSESPADPDAYAWSEFVDDAAAFADALDLKGILGLGHSMGGFVIAGAAAKTQGDFRFRGLALADPVLIDDQDPARRRPLPPAGAPPRDKAADARERRPSWRSAAAMFKSYRKRPPFDTWDEAALHDYCDHALVSEGTPPFALACSPEIEAATFARTMDTNPWPGMARLGIPVAVMRGLGDHGLPSTTSPRTASATPHGYDVPIPGVSHFIPMERPDRVADEVGRLARRLNILG